MEKKKYWVHVREVHISSRLVEAESGEEAKELGKDLDNSIEDYLEFSHLLGEENTTVELCK